MNLAGIIPVAGQRLDYGVPWDDCMMPIAQDYLAIERSVAECLYAGCQTIWIVASIEQQPLIRHRLMERFHDPESFNRYRTGSNKREKEVCLYYIPILQRDYIRRNSIVWSSIFGVLNIKKMVGKISSLLVPEKYFISFPYGVYHPWEIKSCRKYLKQSKYQVMVRHDGRTAADGEYLGLTLTWEEAKHLERHLKDKAYNSEVKYAAKSFSLKDVYEVLETTEDTIYCDIPEYHDTSSWEKYHDFLSNHSLKLTKPYSLFSNKEWNGIGVEEE
jgi:hypothetical protein